MQAGSEHGSQPNTAACVGEPSGLWLLFVVEEGMVEFGPELLEEEGDGVDADVGCPLLAGVGQGSLWGGVVKVGDACAHGRADDFARVEGGLARVGAGDEDAREGVASTFGKAAGTEGVVTGVFVGDGGNDELDHVVFDGLIDIGVPVVASESGEALVKLGCGVAGLRLCGDDAGKDEGGVVEAILRGGDELVFDGLGREDGACADGSKVGDDAKDALGLLIDVDGSGWIGGGCCRGLG